MLGGPRILWLGWTDALILENLGFVDVSGRNNQVNSAVHVIQAEEWNFTNVRCTNLKNTGGLGKGVCFFLEGQTGANASMVTQFSLIINPNVETVNFPIQ